MIEKPLTPKQIAELREKLDNANKTIEHLTRAYNTLRERYDEEHKKYRDESERMKRTVEAVSLEQGCQHCGSRLKEHWPGCPTLD